MQIMVGRIPSTSSRVVGIGQEGDGPADYARAAQERPFPWQALPAEMQGFRALIDAMTLPDRRQRPLAKQALAHPWFASSSNAELPAETLRALVTTGQGHSARERVMDQLQVMNNLDELRSMHAAFLDVATPKMRSAQRPDARELLEGHGVEPEVAEEFVQSCRGQDGAVVLAGTIQETLEAKEGYNVQFVRDLFEELDVDGSGTLSSGELRTLLDSNAFECPYEDVDEVMEAMDYNRDGSVSWEEFKRAVLHDGRVARRSVAQSGFSCAVM